MQTGAGNVVNFMDYLRHKSPGIVKGVGLCAVFSRQGEWAFDYARFLARHHRTRLNIFHFLESPYKLRRDVVFIDAEKERPAKSHRNLSPARIKSYVTPLRSDLAITRRSDSGCAKEMTNSSFGNVSGRASMKFWSSGTSPRGAAFGGTTTIESFTRRSKGPVVLVGPAAPDCYFLNEAAERRLVDLMIPAENGSASGPAEDGVSVILRLTSWPS